jgi:hypothetical protein
MSSIAATATDHGGIRSAAFAEAVLHLIDNDDECTRVHVEQFRGSDGVRFTQV